MIEAYALLAMFTLQILAASLLYPAWFTRHLRLQAASIPAERLAQLYPGIDRSLARARFFARYRVLNVVIAVLGLLLLGGFFSHVRRPGWDYGRVELLVAVYFILQLLLPLGLVLWHGVRFGKVRRRSLLEGKRKAILQPRGLFDFVSPFVVFLAATSYLLFITFVIYFQPHPFRELSGFIYIGGVTLVYALQASVVYAVLSGKNPNPFEAHAGRVRTIGLVVKSCLYSCIACVAFFAVNFTLGVLNLQTWAAFVLSVFFVVTALLSLMGMVPRAAAGLGSGGRTSPETQDLSA